MDNVRRWLTTQWDRAAAVAAVLLGAMALLLGWYGMSDSAFPAAQLPYIVSGGMVGLFAVGIGATLWLSADLRDEWRKLDGIEQRMDRIVESLSSSDTPTVADAAPAARRAPRRSAAGSSR